MQADISAFESLQQTATVAPPATLPAAPQKVPPVSLDFNPELANELLHNLSAEAESYIAMMRVGLDCIERQEGDFKTRFAAATNYAEASDLPQARELAIAACVVKEKLTAAKKRCGEIIRTQ